MSRHFPARKLEKKMELVLLKVETYRFCFLFKGTFQLLNGTGKLLEQPERMLLGKMELHPIRGEAQYS